MPLTGALWSVTPFTTRNIVVLCFGEMYWGFKVILIHVIRYQYSLAQGWEGHLIGRPDVLALHAHGPLGHR